MRKDPSIETKRKWKRRVNRVLNQKFRKVIKLRK